jgi:hypothetical protein
MYINAKDKTGKLRVNNNKVQWRKDISDPWKSDLTIKKIRIFQLLGGLPKEYKETDLQWGVKLEYKLGKYYFSVNVPHKLKITDYSKLKIIYDFNIIVKEGKKNTIHIRSYLPKRPEYAIRLTQDVLKALSTFLSNILYIDRQKVISLFKDITIT